MIEIKPLTGRDIGISLLLLTVLALLVRLPLISGAPMMDELYHLFAAKSWLADGELTIADGEYTRASGYTKLIAFGFGLFGEHIEVLRMLGVIAATVTLIALFFWTRASAGAVAAWIAALFFCFWPDGIAVSVHHRFYAPHGMFFLLGAISVYLMVEQRDWWEKSTLIALGINAAVMFALALLLQKTTLLGIAGVALWVMLVIGQPWLIRQEPGRRWLAIAGLAVLGIGALALLALSGIGAGLLDAFRWTPDWAAASKNQFWFYHALLTLYYPTLWSVTGIAFLIAMAYRPRLIGFCLCIFLPAFVLQSIGGMKHLRYVYYIMPFLFVIWGVALAHLIERFWPFLKEAADKTLDVLAPNLPKRPLRAGLIGAVLLFTLFANAASIKTVAMLAGVTVPPMTKPPEWDVASEALQPYLEGAVLLTTSEMETLYAFDRYDILISNSRMSELLRNNGGHLDGQDIGEFSVDWRTGRPVVSEPESIDLIMSCFEKGVIVSNVYRWRFGPQLDDEVADVIEARATKIDLPPSSRITAYRWDAAASGASTVSGASTANGTSIGSGASTASGASAASRSPACDKLAANHPAPTLSEARAQPADSTHASRAYAD
ncbi:MAG: hypothetical protein AAGC99_11510 [Pseudomonadota bacterium]